MPELTAEKAASIALKQLESCEKFKQTRLSRILEMQQAYYGKFRPSPRGRSGIPLPFFSKYVDEVKARIDESPIVKFKHKHDSDILVARKVQSAAEADRSPSSGDWNRKDRMSKFMAIFSGVGAYDYFAESAPDYASHLEAVDVFDFYFEPTGGSDLEEHAFVGKANIFRSQSEMEAMAEEGVYDSKMVKLMMRKGEEAGYKEVQKKYLSRYDRFKAMGLDMQGENYIGEKFYPLAQWQMSYGGRRYFLVFDMISGKPARFAPLKEVFKSRLYSMTMWQTHEDPHTVLPKSPADDMWVIAEWLRVMGNYLIDHGTKNVWGQIVYDPNFIESSELEWKGPQQLSMGKAYGGQPISNGIFQLQTPDKTIVTIDLMKYFENLLASVSGTAPADVSQEEARAAVMFGNIQKVSARLGVYNHAYSEAWNKIATRYVWGLKEHLTEPMAVKLIGERGVEWDELRKNDLTDKTDFDIEVVGASVELEMSEATKKKQNEAIALILKDPDLKRQMNPKVLAEEVWRSAGFKEEAIKRAMDTENFGSERSISHAASVIENILKGRKPEPYGAADVAFLKYLFDFTKENDIAVEKKTAIIEYGREHVKIAVRNSAFDATWKASLLKIQQASQPQESGAGSGKFVPETTPQRTPVGTPSGVVPQTGTTVVQQ